MESSYSPPEWLRARISQENIFVIVYQEDPFSPTWEGPEDGKGNVSEADVESYGLVSENHQESESTST